MRLRVEEVQHVETCRFSALKRTLAFRIPETVVVGHHQVR